MRLVWLPPCTVFILTFLLSLWANDFSACYHPDEPEKVAQVLNGRRNFRHPPLMLDAASAVLHLVSDPRGAASDQVVRVGRWLSAFYTAAACAGFTWLAKLYGGTLGAVFAGCLLAGNTHALLAGHFFKEDSLFALGLCLTFLAGAYRWRNQRGWFALIILGAAAGFAAGAKYLGIIALVYALILESAIRRRSSSASHVVWRLFLLLFSGLAVAFVLVIISGLHHLPELCRALFAAGQIAYAGNEGVGAKVPHAQYLGIFFLEPPLALLGLIVCVWTFKRDARPIVSYVDRWLLLYAPAAFLLIFSFSTITAVRYFLPISLLVACLGGVGLAEVTRMIGNWAQRRWLLRSRLAAGGVVIVCVTAQLPALVLLERGFTSDDHRALRSYIAAKLPANAVIAADQLACLDKTGLPQRVFTRRAIADLGDFSALRAQGVTHVVVCWYDSRRYVTARKHPTAAAETDFLRRRDFYLGLKSHARLLWNSELAQPFQLRPGLALYELSHAPAAVP